MLTAEKAATVWLGVAAPGRLKFMSTENPAWISGKSDETHRRKMLK